MDIRKIILLDLVEDNLEIESEIRKYDDLVGTCLLCNHLFDNIEMIEEKYSCDLTELVKIIEMSIEN